jgi:hypothetical protein
MQTIEVIATIYGLLAGLFGMIAKVNGTGVIGTLVVKLASFISFIWFGYKLLMIIP